MSQKGIEDAATTLNAIEAAWWAVLSVETSGCGYLLDRRPKIPCSSAISSTA